MEMKWNRNGNEMESKQKSQKYLPNCYKLYEEEPNQNTVNNIMGLTRIAIGI